MKRLIGKLLCALGFHKLTDIELPLLDISIHARCARCGKVGMLDSQGNLF